MAANILKSWLSGQRSAALWIEYEDYARRVFAGSPPDWYGQAVRFANTIAQARSAIRTEVLSIDVVAPFLAAAPAGAGEDLSAAQQIQARLSESGPIAFVHEAIDALAHKLAPQVDLVLKLHAPVDLLARYGGGAPPSFDDLDDVSVALANLIRPLAEKPIAGLLLVRQTGQGWSPDESDAYGTIFSAAKHYGWVTALELAAALVADLIATGAAPDLLLCGELPVAELDQIAGGPRQLGGGLGAAYWLRGVPAIGPEVSALLYGVVPRDAEPESVLARCQSLSR